MAQNNESPKSPGRISPYKVAFLGSNNVCELLRWLTVKIDPIPVNTECLNAPELIGCRVAHGPMFARLGTHLVNRLIHCAQPYSSSCSRAIRFDFA